MSTKDRKDKDSVVGAFSDTLKKTIASGVSAISGDDNIKERINDFTLHKEIANSILGFTEKAKDDVLEVVKAELRRFLDKKDWQDHLRELLKGTTIEVKAKVRISKDDGSVLTDIDIDSKPDHNSEEMDK